MTFRFRHARHIVTSTRPSADLRAHRVTSDFDSGRCRFTLDCACGVRHDTPFIDEALEWRELHESLAPLADQLSG